MNRSRLKLGRAGMVVDGGAPHCGGCHQPLQFGTDREGRTTESCACGYRGYLQTRPGQVGVPPDAPGSVRVSAPAPGALPLRLPTRSLKAR